MMDDVNFFCELHNSPIGGICSDLFCKSNPLLCIKCAVAEDSCIRIHNHELITFEEFFKKYENGLNQNFPEKKINLLEFLKFIKDFKFIHAEKEFLSKMKERDGINIKCAEDLKEKIIQIGMKSNINNRIDKINGALRQIDDLKMSIDDLKIKGLDLIPLNSEKNGKFYEKFENLSKNYFEFESLKKENLQLIFENENTGINVTNVEEININNEINKQDPNYLDNSTDYTLVQKLIKLTKYIDCESKLSQIVDSINHSISILDFYQTKTKLDFDVHRDEEIKKFTQVLGSIETSIPSLFSNTIQNISLPVLNVNKAKESKIENENEYVNLSKYISDNSTYNNDQIVFSYQNPEYFNTTKKSKFSNLDPKLLKQTHSLVKNFNKRNRIDNMALFTTADGINYLAYASEDLSLYILNLSDTHLNDKMKNRSIEYFNEIDKIEHYQRGNGIDYLITCTQNMTINKIEYDHNEKKFNLIFTSFKLDYSIFTFEILEINMHPFIIVPLKNERIRIFKLDDFSATKDLCTDFKSVVYSAYAFWHKYLKKMFIVLSTAKSLVIYNFLTFLHYKTFKTGANNLNSSVIILDKPAENDYYFITNIKTNIRVLKFSQDYIFKTIKFTQNEQLSGMAMWSEKVFCVGNEKGEILFCDVETGDLVHSFKAHEQSITNLKKFTLKDYGDVLFSSSLDQTIKLWTI